MPGEAALRNAPRTLVLGGARSGKSRHAQALCEQSGLRLVFCATARDWGDAEMAERIARHRADRDERWTTVDAPLDLPATLLRVAEPGTMVLVDCLTLWLSNLLLEDGDVPGGTAALVRALGEVAGPVVLVSNEVGFGLVPETPLGRRFRDAQGRLNQAVAAVCETAVLVVAGLPLRLKP